jgi:hypothetical protein
MQWLSASHIITDFLYPSERVALRWCSQKTRERITWNLIEKGFDQIVLKEMKKYMNQDTNDILKMLKKHENVLCGSFLLRCITGNIQISPNDIDVYFMAKTENIASFLEKKQNGEINVHDFSHLLRQNHTLLNARRSLS